MNLKNILKFKKSTGLPKFSRDDMLVWGTVASMFLFLCFLTFDGYIFYTIGLEKDTAVEPSDSKITLSNENFSKTIQLLDQREKIFQEISKSSSKVQATATTTQTLPINLLLP